MVAARQLVDLGDPALVSRLANLFENLNPRLEYNGEISDDWVIGIAVHRPTRSPCSKPSSAWEDHHLISLELFRRSGFLALYALRLGYYLIWHIAWGASPPSAALWK